MKIVILGVVALALGLGGGAYVGGSRVKDEILAARAEAHADSLATAESHEEAPDMPGEVVHVAAALPDPEHAQASPDVDAGPAAQEDHGAVAERDASHQESAPVEGGQSTEAAAEAMARTAEAVRAEPDSAALEGAIKLSRIFSAMKPVDAAAVLQEMNDLEVEAIMKHMQARLAGQILGEFAPERAASLSRVVLQAGTGS